MSRLTPKEEARIREMEREIEEVEQTPPDTIPDLPAFTTWDVEFLISVIRRLQGKAKGEK